VPYIAVDDTNLAAIDDEGRCQECVRDRLCQVCGAPLNDERGYGIPIFGSTPPTQGFNGHALMHRECLEIGLAHCPRLREHVRAGMLVVIAEPIGRRYATRLWPNRGTRVEIDPGSVDWELVVSATHQAAAPSRQTLQQLATAGISCDITPEV
jgi:hypothetical protein